MKRGLFSAPPCLGSRAASRGPAASAATATAAAAAAAAAAEAVAGAARWERGCERPTSSGGTEDMRRSQRITWGAHLNTCVRGGGGLAVLYAFCVTARSLACGRSGRASRELARLRCRLVDFDTLAGHSLCPPGSWSVTYLWWAVIL